MSSKILVTFRGPLPTSEIIVTFLQGLVTSNKEILHSSLTAPPMPATALNIPLTIRVFI
jgi:hypothetical protein